VAYVSKDEDIRMACEEAEIRHIAENRKKREGKDEETNPE